MEKSRNAHSGRNARARQRVAGPGDVAGGRRVSTGPADTYVGGFRRPARPAGDGEPSASSHSHPFPLEQGRRRQDKPGSVRGKENGAGNHRPHPRICAASLPRKEEGKEGVRRSTRQPTTEGLPPVHRSRCPLAVLRVSGICLFRGERGLARAPFFFSRSVADSEEYIRKMRGPLEKTRGGHERSTEGVWRLFVLFLCANDTQTADITFATTMLARTALALRTTTTRSPLLRTAAGAGIRPQLLQQTRGYHPKVIDHYQNPRNVGTMDKSLSNVGTGLVGAPACGDVMRLQIKVNDKTGVIEDVKFKTFGCGSAIASSSYATELVKGMTLDEAANIKNTTIAKELSLPPVKLHCSMLAEDAIKSAIKDYRAKRGKVTLGPNASK